MFCGEKIKYIEIDSSKSRNKGFIRIWELKKKKKNQSSSQSGHLRIKDENDGDVWKNEILEPQGKFLEMNGNL